MTPYRLYMKSLFEGAGFAFDEDEANFGYADDDDDDESMPADEYDDDDQDSPDSRTRGNIVNEIDDAEQAESVPPVTNNPDARTGSSKYDKKKMSKTTLLATQKKQADADEDELRGEIVDLAAAVYDAYSDIGVDFEKVPDAAGYADTISKVVSNESGLYCTGIVRSLEGLGIAMNHAGISLGEDDCESFTPDMLSRMYFLGMPSDKYIYDVPIPDDVLLRNIANKINSHIKGTADGEPVLKETNVYSQLSGIVAKMDKTVSGSKRKSVSTRADKTIIANADVTNANVTHVDHVPEGRAFYFVPHVIFGMVRKAMEDNQLAKSFDVDDLAAEYMFLGSTEFKKKYKTAPRVSFTAAMRNAGIRLSTPCYGSIGEGGEVRFTTSFKNILLVSELNMCRKGHGGIIKDRSGTPMPTMGDALVADVSGAVSNGDLLQVVSNNLCDAIRGEFSYATKSGEQPLFDYFTTNTLTVSSSRRSGMQSGGGDGDETADDRGGMAAKQDEYMRHRDEDTDSGNVILNNIDNNLWNIMEEDGTKTLLSMFNLPAPDPRYDDLVNMQRVTAILVAISGIFEAAGARSRIVSYDNVHPVVEIDDTEIGTNDSITTAWTKALSRNGGKKGAIPSKFRTIKLYDITKALLDWANSFSGKFQGTLEDTLQKLGIASVLDEAIDDLTPDVNIDDIIGNFLEECDQYGNLDASKQDTIYDFMAKYTYAYVKRRSREIMCPFLEDINEFWSLIQFLDMKFTDEDALEERHYSYLDNCTIQLARLVKWDVRLDRLNVYRPEPEDEDEFDTDASTAGSQISTYSASNLQARPLPMYSSRKPEAFRWFINLVTRGSNKAAITMILIGMLEFARDMKREEYSDSSNTNYAYEGETRIMSLRMAYDRYGQTEFLAMIGLACGDSGNAINTLFRTLNTRVPIDNESDLAQVADAVRTLSKVDGIKFNIDVTEATDHDVMSTDNYSTAQ